MSRKLRNIPIFNEFTGTGLIVIGLISFVIIAIIVFTILAVLYLGR